MPLDIKSLIICIDVMILTPCTVELKKHVMRHVMRQVEIFLRITRTKISCGNFMNVQKDNSFIHCLSRYSDSAIFFYENLYTRSNNKQ